MIDVLTTDLLCCLDHIVNLLHWTIGIILLYLTALSYLKKFNNKTNITIDRNDIYAAKGDETPTWEVSSDDEYTGEKHPDFAVNFALQIIKDEQEKLERREKRAAAKRSRERLKQTQTCLLIEESSVDQLFDNEIQLMATVSEQIIPGTAVSADENIIRTNFGDTNAMQENCKVVTILKRNIDMIPLANEQQQPVLTSRDTLSPIVEEVETSGGLRVTPVVNVIPVTLAPGGKRERKRKTSRKKLEKQKVRFLEYCIAHDI